MERAVCLCFPLFIAVCYYVMWMIEMGALDLGDRNHARTTLSSSSWSRVNGWSWPPHPFQLIAWAVFVYITLFFYLTTIPALVVAAQVACYVVSLLVAANVSSCSNRKNKPVGDRSPRLAQISLPWQQGSAPKFSGLPTFPRQICRGESATKGGDVVM